MRCRMCILLFYTADTALVDLIEVYGCADKTLLRRLYLLQRRALKTVFGLNRMCPTEDFFARVAVIGIVPLKALYFCGAVIYGVKILRGMVHSGLVFNRRTMSAIRTRSADDFSVIPACLGYGTRRFMYVLVELLMSSRVLSLVPLR